MSSHGHNGIAVPSTSTPVSVYIGIVLTLFLILIFLVLLLLPLGPWPFILTGVAFGLMTMSGVIAIDMPDWHAGQYFNSLSKKRRVIFSGFHWKLPWETLEGEFISLRKELSDEKKVKFTTNDPAEEMDVEILVLIKPEVSGSPHEATEKLIRFNSISNHDLRHLVGTEVVKLFGNYYGDHEMEKLTKLEITQRAVVNSQEWKDNIHKLEHTYGCHIGATLGKSVPDENTKATKRTVGRAEALRDAIKKLVKGGMDPEMARRAALLLDPNADFTEHRSDFHAGVKVEGMENLQTLIMGQPPTIDPKKGAPKK